jgi:hypothetical protein
MGNHFRLNLFSVFCKTSTPIYTILIWSTVYTHLRILVYAPFYLFFDLVDGIMYLTIPWIKTSYLTNIYIFYLKPWLYICSIIHLDIRQYFPRSRSFNRKFVFLDVLSGRVKSCNHDVPQTCSTVCPDFLQRKMLALSVMVFLTPSRNLEMSSWYSLSQE